MTKSEAFASDFQFSRRRLSIMNDDTATVIILYQNGMKQEENCDMIGMKKVQMRYRQTPVGQTEHRAEKMGVQK